MSMWHYNQSGRQHGPIELGELTAEISAGNITGDTLVWEVGTKDWIVLKDHPELGAAVQVPPPLPPLASLGRRSRSVLTTVVDGVPPLVVLLPWVAILFAVLFLPSLAGATDRPYVVAELGWVILSGAILGSIILMVVLRPAADVASPSLAWRRLLAKLIDIGLASVIVSLILWLVEPTNTVLLVSITWYGTIFLWALMDAFLLKSQTNTLGRKLLGIRVQPIEEGALKPNYLRRSFHLAFAGMAIGVPLVATLMQAISYKRLRETGTTAWDRDRFSVSYDRVRLGNVAVGIAAVVFGIAINGAIGNSIIRSSAIKAQIEAQRKEADERRQTSVWKNDITKRIAQFPFKLLVENGHSPGSIDFYWKTNSGQLVQVVLIPNKTVDAFISEEEKINKKGYISSEKRIEVDGWSVYSAKLNIAQGIDQAVVIFRKSPGMSWELSFGVSSNSPEETKRACMVMQAIAETFEFTRWNALRDANFVPHCSPV